MYTYTKTLPQLLETDVVVVGSGSAGSTAAIAAARGGARTVLVERYGFLGGTSTQVLDTFYGFYTPGTAPIKVVGGIPDDVVSGLKDFGAAFERPNTFGAGTGITYDPELLKVVWERLAQQAGVTLLYHTFCTDVLMDGGRITGLIVDGKQGLSVIRARVVIDCSGDADVCARAGAPFERAGDIDPAQTLSTTFRMVNVDTARASGFSKKELWARMAEAADSGTYRLPRREGSWHPTTQDGVIHTIMTRVADLDGTDPQQLSLAETEGRAQALEYARFLHDRVPGFERAQLSWLSHPIGVRETRRVHGQYRLTRQDCLEARKFADAIGACGAPIEDHHSGSDTTWVYLPEGQTYDIPYGTLLPQQVQGLLVAGRCFSATHDAHASCRSMAQTMTMGQAAGTAAALSLQHDTLPHALQVSVLQEKLTELGAKFGELPQEVPS